MSLATTDTFGQTIHHDLTWLIQQSRAAVVRPIEQWVEDELILPSGPYRGERYRHRRHPVSRLWFRCLADSRWNRFAATGPTQNGKTLMCYVAPVMYHLFELQETVIIGLPTMQMAQDKWTEDLLPAIEASRYRELLPLSGEGSRGGMVKRAIRFRNDVTLRFMTAGGGDKQRAGYTSRVLAITETDGMDEPGESSREADAIEQLEGRTRAYGDSKRVYLECTASIERGRIWQELTHGSDSRIYRPCCKCGQYVSPEREHLAGWQDAETEIQAAEMARWACPACGTLWTDDDRWAAAGAAVLVHRGQTVLPSGDVVGDRPATRTLGFRWSAIDNPFVTVGELAADEWRAARSNDRDGAEKKMRQFVWALPWIAPDVQLTPLDAEAVADRTAVLRKGIVPPDAVGLAIGVDTGKRELHWHLVAMRAGGGTHVVEYGVQPTDADRIGVVQGLTAALDGLLNYFSDGWLNESGQRCQALQVWIDSGWQEHREAVYEFCRRANAGRPPGQEVYRPSKGFGERQRGTIRYAAPKAKGGDVRYIGTEYDFRHQRAERIILVHVNSDYWKSQVHQRLAMGRDATEAMTLYESASPMEHVDYSHQITAEIQTEEWLDGRGEVVIWKRVRRANHFLDAAYLSLAAGHFIASEIERQKQQEASREQGGWFERQQRGRRSA
jgi:phage terminase large subunit GpA-like protein